jgi:5-methylcytosine-specific restriction endonuclease McrA
MADAIPNIISRAEAKALGLKRFFTGKPCKRGHVAERRVTNRACSVCQAASYREDSRRRRAADPEKYREKNRKWSAANLDTRRKWRAANREKLRECQRKRNAANPEKQREHDRKWIAANREKNRESQRKWYAKNPDKVRVNSRLRRARKQGAEGRHTAAAVADIFKMQRGRCAYFAKCGQKLVAYHIDHIVPLSKGGTNNPSNLQLTCPICNISKGAKDPIVYAQRIGLLL